jgi:putative oxidoreductase
MNATFAQPVLSLLGRLALASFFLWTGWGEIRSWGGFVQAMSGQGLPLPWLVLPIVITVQIAGAVALLLGLRTRWAAFGLLVVTIVLTWYLHRYWSAPPADMRDEAIDFYKNAAVAGGLLYVMAYGPGSWSLDRS